MIDRTKIEMLGVKFAKKKVEKQEYMDYLLNNATMYEMAELVVKYHKLYILSKIDKTNKIEITLSDFKQLCSLLRIKGVKEIKSNGEFIFDNRGVKTGRPSENLPLYKEEDIED